MSDLYMRAGTADIGNGQMISMLVKSGSLVKVEPDYEAAARELHEQSAEDNDTYEAAQAVVDAALWRLEDA